MKTTFKTLLIAAAATALIPTAQAHDSTRHNDGRYTDHTHTERNMMDAGARTAGRNGVYKSNNEDGYVYTDPSLYVNKDVYVTPRGNVGVTSDDRYTEKQIRARMSASQDTTPYSNMTKRQVRYVQNKLDMNGYDLAVDGIYGPQTRAALRSYQRNNGLSVTGNVNEQTLADMGIATNASMRMR